MMPRLVFTVGGAPVPQSRTNTSTSGVRFTPKRTRDYQKLVARTAVDAMRAQGWESGVGPYAVTLLVTRKHMRGDLDNFAKAALDGMNRVVFADDRHIHVLYVQFAGDDGVGEPRLDVVIDQLEPRAPKSKAKRARKSVTP